MAKGYDHRNPKAATEAPAKPRKKSLKSIEMERSANGGYIVRHRFDNYGSGPYHEPEEHTFGSAESSKVLDHVTKHMGLSSAQPDNDGDDD